jgi:hypothetical protein
LTIINSKSFSVDSSNRNSSESSKQLCTSHSQSQQTANQTLYKRDKQDRKIFSFLNSIDVCNTSNSGGSSSSSSSSSNSSGNISIRSGTSQRQQYNSLKQQHKSCKSRSGRINCSERKIKKLKLSKHIEVSLPSINITPDSSSTSSPTSTASSSVTTTNKVASADNKESSSNATELNLCDTDQCNETPTLQQTQQHRQALLINVGVRCTCNRKPIQNNNRSITRLAAAQQRLERLLVAKEQLIATQQQQQQQQSFWSSSSSVLSSELISSSSSNSSGSNNNNNNNNNSHNNNNSNIQEDEDDIIPFDECEYEKITTSTATAVAALAAPSATVINNESSLASLETSLTSSSAHVLVRDATSISLTIHSTHSKTSTNSEFASNKANKAKRTRYIKSKSLSFLIDLKKACNNLSKLLNDDYNQKHTSEKSTRRTIMSETKLLLLLNDSLGGIASVGVTSCSSSSSSSSASAKNNTSSDGDGDSGLGGIVERLSDTKKAAAVSESVQENNEQSPLLTTGSLKNSRTESEIVDKLRSLNSTRIGGGSSNFASGVVDESILSKHRLHACRHRHHRYRKKGLSYTCNDLSYYYSLTDVKYYNLDEGDDDEENIIRNKKAELRVANPTSKYFDESSLSSCCSPRSSVASPTTSSSLSPFDHYSNNNNNNKPACIFTEATGSINEGRLMDASKSIDKQGVDSTIADSHGHDYNSSLYENYNCFDEDSARRVSGLYRNPYQKSYSDYAMSMHAHHDLFRIGGGGGSEKLIRRARKQTHKLDSIRFPVESIGSRSYFISNSLSKRKTYTKKKCSMCSKTNHYGSKWPARLSKFAHARHCARLSKRATDENDADADDDDDDDDEVSNYDDLNLSDHRESIRGESSIEESHDLELDYDDMSHHSYEVFKFSMPSSGGAMGRTSDPTNNNLAASKSSVYDNDDNCYLSKMNKIDSSPNGKKYSWLKLFILYYLSHFIKFVYVFRIGYTHSKCRASTTTTASASATAAVSRKKRGKCDE